MSAIGDLPRDGVAMSHWRRTSHHRDRRRERLLELQEQDRLEEQADEGKGVACGSALADDADDEQT